MDKYILSWLDTVNHRKIFITYETLNEARNGRRMLANQDDTADSSISVCIESNNMETVELRSESADKTELVELRAALNKIGVLFEDDTITAESVIDDCTNIINALNSQSINEVLLP